MIRFVIFGVVCAAEASWMLSDQREECMEAIYGDEEGLSQYHAREIELVRRSRFWTEWFHLYARINPRLNLLTLTGEQLGAVIQ